MCAHFQQNIKYVWIHILTYKDSTEISLISPLFNICVPQVFDIGLKVIAVLSCTDYKNLIILPDIRDVSCRDFWSPEDYSLFH